jgi:hypothetical protein
MKNLNEFHAEDQAAVEAVGGEFLAGSGFESEIPDTEFSEPGESPEGGGR